MQITYRRVDLENSAEMQLIAQIDMAIPAALDPLFKVNEKTISERLTQLMKCKSDDFFEVAVNDDGKIIAYHFMNKFNTPHGLMAANVQTLWVNPDFRNRGLATTLKQRGESWATEQNLDHISTFVQSKNSSMLALNQNLGYELVGHKLRKNLR